MELYTIEKLTDNQGNVYFPEPLFGKLRRHHHLSFGTKICRCDVKRSKKKNTVFICSDIWDELMIPYSNTIHIIANDDVIHIGPVVGVFTAGFTGSLLRPIGDRTIFFAKLLSSEKSVGAFTFVFGAHHINWESGMINGFFHTATGWQQKQVPFPNVVYDRLPNRKTESQPILKEIKKRIQVEYLIPWFNPGFFNKWDIHQIFAKHEVKKYLPETVVNPTLPTIAELLAKYKRVYIKPINGSLGLGIQQIFQINDDDSYYCRFRSDDQNFLRKYKSLEKLLSHQFRASTLEGFIAQQGISLIRLNDKTIDFRVHTNKDEYGHWRVSAIAAKVAGPGSVTTHIGSGGIVKTIEEILEATGLSSATVANIEQAVLAMSSVLDLEIPGNIGEIGYDLGIDKNGEIWFFEANSKPGRSIFQHPKLKKSDQLSRSLPISYAIYLTKKAILEPGVPFYEDN